MDNKLKKILMVLYFFTIFNVCINIFGLSNIFIAIIFHPLSLFVLIIIIIIKEKILYFSIFIKLLIFDIFLLSFSMFIFVVLDLSIGYSFGGSLFSTTSLLKFLSIDKSSIEAKILFAGLFFLLSNIILFTIVKPFINHLDKSIRKIKSKENTNKENNK